MSNTMNLYNINLKLALLMCKVADVNVLNIGIIFNLIVYKIIQITNIF